MRRRAHATPTVQGNLHLGLVIVAEAGALDHALASLRASGLVRVGPVQGHRIPAVAATEVGGDELLLRQITGLAGVLHVDVAYAHLVDEVAIESEDP